MDCDANEKDELLSPPTHLFTATHKQSYRLWHSVEPCHETGTLGAAFLIFKAYIGIGMLTLARGFRHSGLLAGVCVLLPLTMLSVWCMRSLVHSKQLIVQRLMAGDRFNLPSHKHTRRELTYGVVAGLALGQHGRSLTDFFICVNQVGGTITYLSFASGQLAALLDRLAGCSLHITSAHIIALCALYLFIVSFVRHAKGFVVLGGIANVLAMFAISVILYYDGMLLSTAGVGGGQVAGAAKGDTAGGGTGGESGVRSGSTDSGSVSGSGGASVGGSLGEGVRLFASPLGVSLFLGQVLYAFEGAPFILELQLSIRNKRVYPRLIALGIAAIGLLYTAFGMLGYLAFGSATSLYVLSDLQTAYQGNVLIAAVTIIFSLSLLVSSAWTLFPAIKATHALVDTIYGCVLNVRESSLRQPLLSSPPPLTLTPTNGTAMDFNTFISEIEQQRGRETEKAKGTTKDVAPLEREPANNASLNKPGAEETTTTPQQLKRVCLLSPPPITNEEPHAPPSPSQPAQSFLTSQSSTASQPTVFPTSPPPPITTSCFSPSLSSPTPSSASASSRPPSLTPILPAMPVMSPCYSSLSLAPDTPPPSPIFPTPSPSFTRQTFITLPSAFFSSKSLWALRLTHVLWRACLVSGIALAAIFGGGVLDTVVSLVGALACCPLSLTIPALIHWRLCRTRQTVRQNVFSLLVACVGVACSVWLCALCVYDIVTREAEPATVCVPW